MCYAVSTSADPLGPYYRYEFLRRCFRTIRVRRSGPTATTCRPARATTSIQKHACVVDRAKMLKGEPATEQCVIIDDVNFLNNADIDGKALPPRGRAEHHDGGRRHAARRRSSRTTASTCGSSTSTGRIRRRRRSTGPTKIAVAPYHYLCDGQLTNCVPQPGTERRLDAQGDKIMARLVYRRVGDRESIVAVHSVNTAAGGGGVRWYEFRIDRQRERRRCYQQGTYAPDGFYRWMASPAIDRFGNIGIGYSFGGTPHFAGQRFAGAARRRSARAADAARDGARRGRGGADEHAALGGLHADGGRSERRLHDLVRRRLPQEGRDELLDADRRVPHARLLRAALRQGCATSVTELVEGPKLVAQAFGLALDHPSTASFSLRSA